MPKLLRNRLCPALGREIPRVECAQNRILRYTCPADCPHHLFGPAAYGSFLEVEGRVDRKLAERLWEDPVLRFRAREELRSLTETANPLEIVHRLRYFTLLTRDEDGSSLADRWERAGLHALSTDERIVLQGQKQLRPALLEVHGILDSETLDAIDLLDEEPSPRTFKDASLAATAGRFTTLLAWIYPAPFFWRLHGDALLISDMSGLEPKKIVSELVCHLGAPPDRAGFEAWLAEHFPLMEQALIAVAAARHQEMVKRTDTVWGAATYRVAGSAKEFAELIRSAPEIDVGPPSGEEHRKGYLASGDWLVDPSEATPDVTPGAQQVLGRILLTKDGCRLEAMGAGTLLRLRQRFESRFGRLVRFVSEERKDLGKKLQTPLPKYKQKLVPPSLLEDVPGLETSSSRVALPPGMSREEFQRQLGLQSAQAWLDVPVPALEGKTPRAAATDTRLRPILLGLLKQRVRAADLEGRKTGHFEDFNWMLEELGAAEIMFEAPWAKTAAP